MRRFVLTFLVFVLGAANGSSSDDATEPPMGELPVFVIDEEGNAIEGAAVRPYALRMVELDGHGFWNREKYGVPQYHLTDDLGKAVIRYPANGDYSGQTLTPRLVTFDVVHSDFVRQVVHFDLGPDKASVTLKRGCEIQLSAIDDRRNPINDFSVLMAGPDAPVVWAAMEDGGLRSSAVNDGTWQTMLVKLQEDGPTLFSDLIPIPVRPSQDFRLRNIELTPGSRLVGTLSPDVPRPVKNGFVVVHAVPAPDGDSWQDESPSLTWRDWTTIDDQGNFEVSSIPRGGEVQIIAICDGWIAQTVTEERGSFVRGQMFDVATSDKGSTEVTVEMEPSGTLQLTLLKPDGTPLDGGSVSSWPNQKYFKGGSTVLGARYRSADSLAQQRLPMDERKQITHRDDMSYMGFMDRPIQKGKAVLNGIPVGPNESLFLSHPEFVLQADQGDRPGQVRFTLPSAEPLEQTLTVTPISSE